LQSRGGRQYERFHSWHYSDNYDQVMATYYQQIYAIDVALGMIRQALADTGSDGNTVIIYTSDNGFLCGSHGYGSKVLPYEESSRVPLIMMDPRHPNSGKGLRSSALTGNVDFAPTMLELAGLPVPPNMDGRSLVAVYDDPTAAIHSWLPLINVWGPKRVHSLGVVSKKWKYIYWPYSQQGMEPTEELYHLAADPLELSNLIAEPTSASERQRMRAVYADAVADWKKAAVPYHNYRDFAKIFERK
jgi:arylsulfatase A-like enzyme